MRRTGLLSLIALGLLVVPTVGAAQPLAPTGPLRTATDVSGEQAGVSESLGRTPTAGSRRVAAAPRAAAARKPAARAATPRRVGKPAGKPVTQPATKPVAKPVAKPVTKPATKPVAKPAGTTTTRPLAVPAAAAPRGGAFAFLHVDAGNPVRWNPCADVPWTFNPAGAPAGGLPAVQAALREISARTGLRFAYQGTSAEPLQAGYLTQSWGQFRPLLVGWASTGSSDLLTGRSASTVGVARVLWTGSYDSTGANRTQIASGVVALNAATTAPTSGAGSWFTYALHELGHAVGLAHVDDASQVMNPVISRSVAGFGSGDLAGLARLGSSAGCLPDVR